MNLILQKSWTESESNLRRSDKVKVYVIVCDTIATVLGCLFIKCLKCLFMLFAYNVFLCIAEGYQCVKADVCEDLYGQCISIVILCGDARSLLGGWGSGVSTCSYHIQPFPKNRSRNYAVLPMLTSSLWHHTGHLWPHQQSPALSLETDLSHGPPKDKCPISKENVKIVFFFFFVILKCIWILKIQIKQFNLSLPGQKAYS